MTYIENVFVCIMSPLLVAALCMGRRQLRVFVFCFAGMGACMLAAYINTFLAGVYGADVFAAAVLPVCWHALERGKMGSEKNSSHTLSANSSHGGISQKP